MSQIEIKPPTGIFKIFFNKIGELKRWVVLLFTIAVPLVFSIWGVRLSIAANNNRESIDTLTVLIKKLTEQNDIMRKSVAIAEDQHNTYISEVKYSKRPILEAEIAGGDFGNPADLYVKISNSGGDIFDLSFSSIKGGRFDSSYIPNNGLLPSKSSKEIRVFNIKNNGGLRFNFRDGAMNRFQQNLIFIPKGNNGELDCQFSPLKELNRNVPTTK